MGNVYLNCPLSGERFWYDWCSYADYLKRYSIYDAGRFLWIGEQNE